MKNLFNLLGSFRDRRRNLDNELLKKFVNQIYNGDSLSHSEALTNLEKGVIEIIYPNGQHCSGGLLITKSGYLITPYHCLKDGKKRFIKTNSNNIYTIIKLCCFSKKNDISLAKANISNSRGIFEYKIVLQNPQIDSVVISILRRGDSESLVNKHCFIKNGNFGIYSPHFFNLSLKSSFGDSGSVISDYNGRLYGLLSSGTKETMDTFPINFFKIIECIEIYRATLMR